MSQTLFPTNLDNFGIILKGKSVEKIKQVYHQYDHAMFVNNFDPEYKQLKKYYQGKHAVQLVNRLATAVCKKSTYEGTGIKDILFSLPKIDKEIQKVVGKYKKRGMNLHYVPKECMRLAAEFSNPNKYTNTGILAFVYAIDIIKAKHIWVSGLDFYTSDYLHRRSHQSPLHKQQKKMNDRNVIEAFNTHILKAHPNTMFHIVTYSDVFPNLDNVEII